MSSIDILLDLFLRQRKVSTDTRTIQKGDLFFALRGINFDGNQYAQKALEAGATHVIVDDDKVAIDNRHILVDDVLTSLQELARHYRKKIIQNVSLVVIAGSNGKTTTKELLNAVVSRKHSTFCTHKNLNNQIGVPLSILSIDAKDEKAIIEIGANHAGEHSLLCGITQPNLALITNCGKDHLEGYGSFEGVVNATKEIVDYMNKQGGQLILNADDIALHKLSQKSHYFYGAQNKIFPHEERQYVAKGKIKKRFPLLTIQANDIDIETQLFGSFQLYNVLATIALAKLWKIEDDIIKGGIKKYTPSQNRTQLVQWKKNKLLLDAYNANPTSVLAMLNEFADYDVPNKIVVLGDMNEMGKHEEREHLNILNTIQAHLFKQVILIGKAYSKHRQAFAHFYYFKGKEQAQIWIDKQGFKACFFLVKGSRSVGLEDIFIN